MKSALLPLVVIISLSILPDLDSVAGFLMGDLGRYHNNWTHSLIVGLGVALVIGSLVWLVRNSGFSRWFLLALLCYELHIIIDYLTVGRGVKAFWPVSLERFVSPVQVFYGLHWSDGWLSTRHLLTLVTEVGFIALISIIVYVVYNKKARISGFTRE
jgi:inner membrane protein